MIIGVDLDDVLLDFFGTFCGYVNKTRGTSYTRENQTDFAVEKSWGWSKEDAYQAVLDFYHSEDHRSAIPVSGAVDAIAQLSKEHTIHVITSKPEFMKEETERWIQKYFPGMISSIQFMNHYHGDGKKRSKAETCRELGIQVFVDDSAEQARNVSSVGIPVLMPDAPWNRQEKVGPLVTRAYSWVEIVKKIQSDSVIPTVGVVGGEDFTDIDVLACTIAYAELLRLEGKKPEAIIPGALNASCPPMIRNLPLKYSTKPSDPNAIYAVVDISEQAYIARCAPIERIVELYDHRAGFEDFWMKQLGPQCHIELVGACATLIWEEYKKRGHAECISPTSADLLAAAILSNTLNFGAQVTHARDHAAFAELLKHVDMPDGWQARYFTEVQRSSVQGDLEQTIKNDTKELKIPGLGYVIVMGQLELWEGKDFIATKQAEMARALESYSHEDWFMSVPSISEGKNYLYCKSERLKELLAKIIGASFAGNIGTTDKMWLRKEVRKKLLELR
jgi:uncharacterized HAD superfamily protein